MTNTNNTNDVLHGLALAADIVARIYCLFDDRTHSSEEFAIARTFGALYDALREAAEDDLLNEKTEDMSDDELTEGVYEILLDEICGDCMADIYEFRKKYYK